MREATTEMLKPTIMDTTLCGPNWPPRVAFRLAEKCATASVLSREEWQNLRSDPGHGR